MFFIKKKRKYSIEIDWMMWDILVDYGNKIILNRFVDKDVFCDNNIM